MTDPSSKTDAIRRIRELMDKRKQKFLVSENKVFTTRNNHPYQITEIRCDKELRITTWSHWDKDMSGYAIESFDDETVKWIESAVIRTLRHIRKFKVKFEGHVYVDATSEENAMKTFDYNSGYGDFRENVYLSRAIEASELIV